jgi:hypothetical protein
MLSTDGILTLVGPSMDDLISLPDGNEVLKGDLPLIIGLIERTARWVHPETFRMLPVWAPHTARGRSSYKANWTERSQNNVRATGKAVDRNERNIAAAKALFSALGIKSPKPKNWTVCHIWGYDDPSFAKSNEIASDPRFYSCVANMILLPTSMKGFTDTIPEIKHMLRVCAFHMYGWTCQHPSVESEAAKVRLGHVPPHYPESWPSPDRPSARPIGTAPYNSRIEERIRRQRESIERQIEDETLTFYPRDHVRRVLGFWGIPI